MTRISKLTISSFRAATCKADILFDAKKPVSLIFGENGTGKSTIADAIDFICNRRFGSLESYSLGQGVQAKKYIPSLGSDAIATFVEVSIDGQTWKAVLKKDKPEVSPSEGCPPARVLRRNNILQFIEQQAKGRYEALKQFIDLPGIEKSEASLRDAHKDADSTFNESARALSQAMDQLEKVWQAEEKPGIDALSWAATEAAQDVSILQASIASIEITLRSFQELEDAINAADEAGKALQLAKQQVDKAIQNQQQVESVEALQSSDLVKLLDDARGFIREQETLKNCPLCEQSIEKNQLLDRLDERIQSMSALKVAVEVTEHAKKQLESKEAVVHQEKSKVCQKGQALALTLSSSSLDEIKTLGIHWAVYSTLLDGQDPNDVRESQAKDLLVQALPSRALLTSRKEREAKSRNHHNAVKNYYDTIIDKQSKSKELEALTKKLKMALDILSEKRKEFVDNVLTEIATEAERLYSTLHPTEGIGKIRFYLKPKAIGSLEFDANFNGVEGIPPQAYYSESHLDTLGVCVFLALTKHFKRKDMIVVLDDVLTSVDSPHLDRFMNMLHDEAGHFGQVIVTTHYRPWRDRYRWAKGPAANTQVVELGPWDLQSGIQTGDFCTAAEELAAALTSPKIDRQAVASKAGILLESLLDFITLKYRCAIPRNSRGEYTLGELVSGVDSKLAKELKCRKENTTSSSKTEIPLKPLIDAATAITWVRNSVGCHFNSLASDITDGEVKTFGKNVLNLSSHLICPSCQMLPTRRPSGSFWQCRCGQIELFPLIYPGADPSTVDDES